MCGWQEVYRTSLYQRLNFAVSLKLLINSIKKKKKTRDFPGGTVVKICLLSKKKKEKDYLPKQGT